MNLPPRAKSVLFVAIQLAAIAYLMLTGPVIAMHSFWLCVETAGLLLVVWAFSVYRIRQLRVTPEVASHGTLVTSGPYRFIRHPMYASVLLASLAVVMSHPSASRLAVWFVLLFDLIGKLRYEEKLLAERFPEYAEYQRRTKRLIPFLF